MEQDRKQFNLGLYSVQCLGQDKQLQEARVNSYALHGMLLLRLLTTMLTSSNHN